MATKRVVPNELSHHDSWNGNDRSGDTAHFAQVSSALIKERILKKAKRRGIGINTPPVTKKVENDKRNKSFKAGNKKLKMQADGLRATVEHHNEHEVFLQNFQKPTVIYRWMALRQKVSPVYLTRNLSYMKRKKSRALKSRANFDLNKLSEIVSPKVVALGNLPSFVTLTYIKSAELAELFSPSPSCMMEVMISKRDVTDETYSFDCVAQFELTLNDSSSNTTAFNIKSDLVCGNPHFRSVIFCLTNPHPKGTKSTFVTEVKCSQSSFVDFFCDGQYDLILKEHKTFELTEYVKLSDGLTAKWVSELPDFQADTEPFLFVKFLVTWQNDPKEAVVPEVKSICKHKIENYSDEISAVRKESSPKTKLSRSFVANRSNNQVDGSPSAQTAKSVLLKFKNCDIVRQMAKMSPELDCPWCTVKCGSILKLLTHFELIHPRFHCTFRDTKDFHEVEISVSNLYDGSFHGNPHSQVSRQGSGTKPVPIRRDPMTSILVWRPNPPTRTLKSFSESGSASLLERPIVNGERLYHNSKTNIPFSVKALESDAFDDEPSGDWLIEQMCKMIDDFTDVNAGEKVMMKLWNMHMHKNNFIGDIQLPMAITSFIDENIDKLRHIYRNFLLHVAHLHLMKCISTVEFAAAVIHFQKKMAERSESELPNVKDVSDGGERKTFKGILD